MFYLSRASSAVPRPTGQDSAQTTNCSTIQTVRAKNSRFAKKLCNIYRTFVSLFHVQSIVSDPLRFDPLRFLRSCSVVRDPYAPPYVKFDAVPPREFMRSASIVHVFTFIYICKRNVLYAYVVQRSREPFGLQPCVAPPMERGFGLGTLSRYESRTWDGTLGRCVHAHGRHSTRVARAVSRSSGCKRSMVRGGSGLGNPSVR